MGSNFAFVGTDRLAVMDPRDIRNSGVFSWPEGKRLDKLTIPPFPLESVAKGSMVLLRPFQDYGVGILDLEAREIARVSRSPALDHFVDLDASERLTGEIALYPHHKTEPQATLHLPDADLGRLRSGAHSPDLQWLALSTKSRAGVWNLGTGRATLYYPFDGGSISKDGVLNTTFEKTEKNPDGKGSKQVLSRVSIELEHQTEIKSVKLPEKEKTREVRYVDNYEVTLEQNPKRSGKSWFEVKNTLTDRVLWSLDLEDEPAWQVGGGALVMQLGAKDKTVEKLMKDSPELKQRVEAATRKEAEVLEVLSLDTGKSLGRIVVNGGLSGRIRRVHVSGRTLFLEDSNNRTLAYSLDSGERNGQQFGRVVSADSQQGLVAVQNESGRLTVFDRSMRQVAEFTFPGNVIYAGFDGNGKRLLAVSGSEDVFILDLP
jgi:hypothetical protein